MVRWVGGPRYDGVVVVPRNVLFMFSFLKPRSFLMSVWKQCLVDNKTRLTCHPSSAFTYQKGGEVERAGERGDTVRKGKGKGKGLGAGAALKGKGRGAEPTGGQKERAARGRMAGN